MVSITSPAVRVHERLNEQGSYEQAAQRAEEAMTACVSDKGPYDKDTAVCAINAGSRLHEVSILDLVGG